MCRHVFPVARFALVLEKSRAVQLSNGFREADAEAVVIDKDDDVGIGCKLSAPVHIASVNVKPLHARQLCYDGWNGSGDNAHARKKKPFLCVFPILGTGSPGKRLHCTCNAQGSQQGDGKQCFVEKTRSDRKILPIVEEVTKG